MTILLFIIAALILLLEGALLASFLTGLRLDPLLLLLGFPLGALFNTLLLFALSIIHVPFSLGIITTLHIVFVLILTASVFFSRKNVSATSEVLELPWTRLRMLAMLMCCFFLFVTTAYAVIHAAFFPTFYSDSFAQWAMRTKMSFFAHTILFEGVTKPHYPVFLHALALHFMIFQGQWADRIANLSSLLFSLSTFASIFFLVRRYFGTLSATCLLTLFACVPLVTMHLAQGYGDIHVGEAALLSSLLLFLAVRTSSTSFIMLSGLFAVAAAWIKLEGIYVVAVPWIITCGYIAVRHQPLRRSIVKATGLVLPLTLLWPVFLTMKGLPITPNGSGFENHLNLFFPIVGSLFNGGSFGVAWFLLLTLFILILTMRRISVLLHPVLLFGMLAFIITIAPFLVTADVVFFLNQETFNRTMLTPLLLLLQGGFLVIAATPLFSRPAGMRQ